MSEDADYWISRFGLQPHPEGGYYRETWRDSPAVGRGSGTAIVYLLRAGEESWWHRVTDAVEIWHFYNGSSLELRIGDEAPIDLSQGTPQAIVPAGAWQYARSTGAYSLVGCTVSPAFHFTGFELAPRTFRPPRRDGYHQLTGVSELVRYEAGLPVAYTSQHDRVPDEAERARLVILIEGFSGHRVRLADWVVSAVNPIESSRTARIELLDAGAVTAAR